MKYTYADIAARNPCWLHDGREDELRRRIGDGVTAMQIATSTEVSVNDRRWLLPRLVPRTEDGRKLLVLWACACAQDARHLLLEEHRDAADCAIQTAVAWAHGAADLEAVRAARDEARWSYYAADAADAAYAADAAANAAAAAYAAYAAANAAYAAAAADPTLAERHLVELARMMERDGE